MGEVILSPRQEQEEVRVTDHFDREHDDLYLKNFPEVITAWENYLTSFWIPWSIERARWDRVHRPYAKLFDMYSYMQTRGEQVELLLGVGLLSWRVDGISIRRPVITARVELGFDEKMGHFTVRPLSSGSELSHELDIIPS